MNNNSVVLIVGVECDDQQTYPELEGWYDGVHIPEVLTAPGVRDARRFKSIEPEPGYPTICTLYEFDSWEDYERYEQHRQMQKQGKAKAFSSGPSFRVVWRKAYMQMS